MPVVQVSLHRCVGAPQNLNKSHLTFNPTLSAEDLLNVSLTLAAMGFGSQLF